jgi:hypothetical protein
VDYDEQPARLGEDRDGEERPSARNDSPVADAEETAGEQQLGPGVGREGVSIEGGCECEAVREPVTDPRRWGGAGKALELVGEGGTE